MMNLICEIAHIWYYELDTKKKEHDGLWMVYIGKSGDARNKQACIIDKVTNIILCIPKSPLPEPT